MKKGGFEQNQGSKDSAGMLLCRSWRYTILWKGRGGYTRRHSSREKGGEGPVKEITKLHMIGRRGGVHKSGKGEGKLR